MPQDVKRNIKGEEGILWIYHRIQILISHCWEQKADSSRSAHKNYGLRRLTGSDATMLPASNLAFYIEEREKKKDAFINTAAKFPRESQGRTLSGLHLLGALC